MIGIVVLAIAGIVAYNSMSDNQQEASVNFSNSHQSAVYEPVAAIISPSSSGYVVSKKSAEIINRITPKTWANYEIKGEAIASETPSKTHEAIFSIFFKSEESEIDRDTQLSIKAYLENTSSRAFSVSGYASNDGSVVFNERLSRNRAENTCKTLISIDSTIDCSVGKTIVGSNDAKDRKAVITPK